MNDRVGTMDKLPPLTIGGNTYTRPCSTLSLGDGNYAVFDIDGNTPDEIEAVKASIKPVAKKRKAETESEDSE